MEAAHSELSSTFRIDDNSEVANVELHDLVGRGRSFQREILADVLKDEGFEVIECTTAEAAELIIASTGTEFQALVTDNNLAGAMSGAELAQYASCRHPQMNIIIMSGRTVNPIPVNATFLQKPFTAEQLLEAVRD